MADNGGALSSSVGLAAEMFVNYVIGGIFVMALVVVYVLIRALVDGVRSAISRARGRVSNGAAAGGSDD